MAKHPPIGTVQPPAQPRLTRLYQLREQLNTAAKVVELQRELYKARARAYSAACAASKMPPPSRQAPLEIGAVESVGRAAAAHGPCDTPAEAAAPDQWHSEAPPEPGVYAAEAVPQAHPPGRFKYHWDGVSWSLPWCGEGRCEEAIARRYAAGSSSIVWHHLIETDKPEAKLCSRNSVTAEWLSELADKLEGKQ